MGKNRHVTPFYFALFSKGPPRDQPRKPRAGRGARIFVFHFPASSCGHLSRVAVSFLGPPQRKHSSRTSGEKGEVFALGLAYSCSQRPKKRELSPAATVPCLPTSTASCSRPLEPDTCIFPGEPISVSGIHASPRSVLAGICAGSKACNKGPERSCIEFVGPEKTRRRSNLG